MKLKYAAGLSMARIAREEHRHPQTVAAIVKTEDQEKFMQEQTEKLYGTFTDKAMDGLGRGLELDCTGRLAFALLCRMGIIPNPNRKQDEKQNKYYGLQANATVEEQDEWMMRKMLAIAIERHKVYGTPLPGLEDEDLGATQNQDDQQPR